MEGKAVRESQKGVGVGIKRVSWGWEMDGKERELGLSLGWDMR